MTWNKEPPIAPDLPEIVAARVLIVDDHELLRNGLANLLNSQPDMQVCGVAAGEEDAWSQARKSQPNLAIIEIFWSLRS